MALSRKKLTRAVLMGMVSTLFFGYLAYAQWEDIRDITRLLEKGRVVQGTVTDHVKSHRSRHCNIAAVVTFRASSVPYATSKYSCEKSTDRFPIGKTVNVRYLDNDPLVAMIDQSHEDPLHQAWVGLSSFLFLLLTTYCFLYVYVISVNRPYSLYR